MKTTWTKREGVVTHMQTTGCADVCWCDVRAAHLESEDPRHREAGALMRAPIKIWPDGVIVWIDNE